MDKNRAKLTEIELKELSELSRKARGAILKMTTLAKSGHPGGSMSTVDFLMTLYKLANISVDNCQNESRDRIIFSHGHVSPAAYSVLGLNNFFNLDEAISQFRLAGSIFEGHVELDVPGIEWASGNLGQGISAACGFALACKQKKIKNHIFVLMGDGEQQKGQLSEARRFAVKYKLNNIIGFIDYNKLQIGGNIENIMPQNIRENYISDGWNVIHIDGHNFAQIQDAIFSSLDSDRPTVIMAKTTMGKGVSFMENQAKYHGSPLKYEQLEMALKELKLGNDLDKYKKLREEFVPTEKKHRNHPQTLIFPINNITYDSKTDNRSAWGAAVADIAKSLSDAEKGNIAVFDNDLKGSVKTNDFEKILPENYYETGIMEHHTATMAGAMSKEGICVFFPGFGVFGIDETYNQHRLNDINETNLKIITTHVGLDVGEDGKTHQCIDYLGIMRNLFHFKVIIPADANQTDRAIRYAASNYGNFSISMGRSKYDPIRNADGSLFFDEDYVYEYGKCDILREGKDATLFVMGTLTPKAIEISDILKNVGLELMVINVSSPTEIKDDVILKAANTKNIFTYEDHNVHTGLGNIIAERLIELQQFVKLHKFGVRDYAMSGNAEDVFRLNKLDPESVVKKIREILSKE